MKEKGRVEEKKTRKKSERKENARVEKKKRKN